MLLKETHSLVGGGCGTLLFPLVNVLYVNLRLIMLLMVFMLLF